MHTVQFTILAFLLSLFLCCQCVSLFLEQLGEKPISCDYEVATEESWQISFCRGLMAAKLQGAGSSEAASRQRLLSNGH